MIDFLKRLFGAGEPVDFADLYQNGARIIDVRTPQEFKNGHIKGSKNIPLQSLQARMDELNASETLILCCASGSRSGAARRILKNYGFEEVYNGGGWQSLQNKLNEG